MIASRIFGRRATILKIQFHGHSCVEIHHESARIIIDPFISPNPMAKTSADDVQVDHILLTHGHADHVADALAIARRNNATIVANAELAGYFAGQGVSAIPMNTGGSVDLGFGRVRLTPAVHSSSLAIEDTRQIIYLGNPNGFIIRLGGKTIYHAGDTDLFLDMKLIGERNDIDVAFLPIGDHFTMGPDDAVAAAEWVRAGLVIPIHYNTFPPIRQDAAAFVAALGSKGIKGQVVEVGQVIEL